MARQGAAFSDWLRCACRQDLQRVTLTSGKQRSLRQLAYRRHHDIYGADTREGSSRWRDRYASTSGPTARALLTHRSTEWPRVLENLLQRLRDIVHNDFPIPTLPPPISLAPTIDPEVVASTPPPAAFSSDAELKDEELPDADDTAPPPNSQSSTKENDAPTDIAAARPPPVPPFEVNHSSQHAMRPADNIEMLESPLPPDLLSLYSSSTRMLERDFAHSPPYTIQRLAELVLYPRKHYRFLPAYLRALDRIVSVSSPISEFPLPPMHAVQSTGFLTNGDTHSNGIVERDGLGSDESLGGALLTPIPWLKNNTLASAASAASQGSEGELHSESTETIEGPHGAGSIETVTVTVNGVPSATSVAHTSPAPQPSSPTLSDQSDASSSSSSTEAVLREQGGITQGELLRQEQEAGVIPKNSPTARRSLFHSGAMAVGREPALLGLPGNAPDLMDDEHPHARGPEEIGMEDMGPQHPSLTGGLDIEAAVGRGRSKSPQPETISEPIAEVLANAATEDDSGRPGKDPKDVEKDIEMLKEAMDMEQAEEAKDADGDVIVADADGRPVDEKASMEITGDIGGADATDATTL